MDITVFWVVMPCNFKRDQYCEEHIASIFRVEEYAKEETSRRGQQSRRLYSTVTDMRTSNSTFFF
jgi:hypothetical protein